MEAYRGDLAYIHDTGFTGFARNAAPGLLRLLRRNRIRGGLVVDAGCGSGVWARELTSSGYHVLGIDISTAMIRLARRHAQEAKFRAASLFAAKLPPCDAVTSIGECVNYAFDPSSGRRRAATQIPGGTGLGDSPGSPGRAQTPAADPPDHQLSPHREALPAQPGGAPVCACGKDPNCSAV
jgi:SAM-dependent methyltransferase